MTERVKWSEDQWIAACGHLIFCDSEDCRFCDRIRKQIADEKATADDARKREAVNQLRQAIDWADNYSPLPRCEHGSALQDHAGERLEPPCGCRLEDKTHE